MKVTIVGCSGSFGGPGNACSCYLIEHGGCRVVLDLGNGALGELQRYGSIYEIDAVILSHLHSDHFVDLGGYYVARKWRPSGAATPPLDVWGPADTPERIAKAHDIDVLDCQSVFRFRDLLEGAPLHAIENSFRIGPFTATAVRVTHPVDAFAIRLTVDGRVFVYSGDTAPCSDLDRLAAAADLFLAEATFQEPRDDAVLGVHLNGRQAGESAARAGVRRLVLTHIPPWTDAKANLAAAAASYRGGPVELARPGTVYTI